MRVILLLILLFSLISVAGFIGGLFFGTSGATIVIALGLFLSFVGIAVLIGR